MQPVTFPDVLVAHKENAPLVSYQGIFCLKSPSKINILPEWLAVKAFFIW
jgi:hypothetical protein